MKKAVSIILIISLIVLPGCWDSREMNELGLVIAVGIDKADSGNYVITVQIANPKQSAQSESGKSSTSEPFFVMSAEGQTLFDATRELTRVSSKRIMWAHNFIIIIGENLARDSIIPVIDYFTHNAELRMKTAIVVSKGNAMEYVALKSSLEDRPGAAYSSIYGYSHLTAQYIETDLLSLCRSYYSEYSQPLLSTISFAKSKLQPGEEISNKLMDQVQFGGSAVFNKDKMVGWLTPDETKGVAWVMNKTGNTLVTVAAPSQPGRYVSVETEKVKTDIIATVEDGKLSVAFEVSGQGNIVEEDATTTLSMDELKKTLEGLVDENVTDNIRMSLDKIQKDYQCDVINLAQNIHAQQNDEWENSIKNDWKNVYPQLSISIHVNITIIGSKLNQIPQNEVKKD